MHAPFYNEELKHSWIDTCFEITGHFQHTDDTDRSTYIVGQQVPSHNVQQGFLPYTITANITFFERYIRDQTLQNVIWKKPEPPPFVVVDD